MFELPLVFVVVVVWRILFHWGLNECVLVQVRAAGGADDGGWLLGRVDC